MSLRSDFFVIFFLIYIIFTPRTLLLYPELIFLFSLFNGTQNTNIQCTSIWNNYILMDCFLYEYSVNFSILSKWIWYEVGLLRSTFTMFLSKNIIHILNSYVLWPVRGDGTHRKQHLHFYSIWPSALNLRTIKFGILIGRITLKLSLKVF